MTSQTCSEALTLTKQGCYNQSSEWASTVRQLLDTTSVQARRAIQDRIAAIPGLSFDRDENGDIWNDTHIGLLVCLFGLEGFSTGVRSKNEAHVYRHLRDLLEIYAEMKLGAGWKDLDRPWEQVAWVDDEWQSNLGEIIHQKLQFELGRDWAGLPTCSDGWEWCSSDDILYAVKSVREANDSWGDEYARATASNGPSRDEYLARFTDVLVNENLREIRVICQVLDQVEFRAPITVERPNFFSM